MAWNAPGRPWDVSRTPRRALGTSFSHDLGEKACRKARGTIFVRFCVARVLSRDSSDVHETSVLVCPKHIRSMFAAHQRAQARASKKQAFWPRKSSPGAPKRRPSEPKSTSDGPVRPEKRVQSASQPAKRIFFSQSNAAGRTRERNAGPARCAWSRSPRTPV